MTLLVLVVDDEADMQPLFRQQFRRDLREGRFELAFADNAGEALRCVEETAGKTLILVLSDINMPGTSGLELLQQVKAVRPDLPVIMVTAYGDPNTRRRAAEGGADGLLAKPIDFAAIRAEIDARLTARGIGA